MSNTMKAILDGLLFGVTSFTGTITGALLEMPKGANISDVGSVTWVVAGLLFLGGAARAWRGYLVEKNG